jgi:hypothetical protein
MALCRPVDGSSFGSPDEQVYAERRQIVERVRQTPRLIRWQADPNRRTRSVRGRGSGAAVLPDSELRGAVASVECVAEEVSSCGAALGKFRDGLVLAFLLYVNVIDRIFFRWFLGRKYKREASKASVITAVCSAFK